MGHVDRRRHSRWSRTSRPRPLRRGLPAACGACGCATAAPTARASPVYRVDVVDRPQARRGGGARLAPRGGRRARGLHPPEPAAGRLLPQGQVAHRARRAQRTCSARRSWPGCWSPSDTGEAGLLQRARRGGLGGGAASRCRPSARRAARALPFFVAPGIISEKIFLAAVDVTGLARASRPGRRLAAGGGRRSSRWRSRGRAGRAIATGEIAGREDRARARPPARAGLSRWPRGDAAGTPGFPCDTVVTYSVGVREPSSQPLLENRLDIHDRKAVRAEARVPALGYRSEARVLRRHLRLHPLAA